MKTTHMAQAAELQRDSAKAYALARNTYETASSDAGLDSVAAKQQAAADAYRRAVTARETLVGI